MNLTLMKKIFFLILFFILVTAQGYAKDVFLEALNKQASHLYNEGQYPEAAKVAEIALKIAEESFAPDSPQVAQNLNNLAAVYDYLGRYADAEPLYKRALAIWEKTLGPDHPNIATARRNLTNLYKKMSEKGREITYFENDYYGIRPGYSTLAEAVKILGEPRDIEPTINGNNYYFEKAIVNISGKDRKHINTIQIVNDYTYSCPNGVKLGDAIEFARKKIKEYKESEGYLYDNKKGIIYWHDGKVITKVVLAYSAL